MAPHNLMATITSYIPDVDEESCRIRHAAARYILAAHALAFRLFSSRIHDVYPKNDYFVNVGLLTEEEKNIIENAPVSISYELPFQVKVFQFHFMRRFNKYFLVGKQFDPKQSWM